MTTEGTHRRMLAELIHIHAVRAEFAEELIGTHLDLAGLESATIETSDDRWKYPRFNAAPLSTKLGAWPRSSQSTYVYGVTKDTGRATVSLSI